MKQLLFALTATALLAAACGTTKEGCLGGLLEPGKWQIGRAHV